MSRSLGRLNSGLRINTGRDDPADLIASESLRSRLRAITTAIHNANRADTIVAVAERGLQEINTLLLEMENLIDQTANESGLTDAEVQANQLQIDSILATINRLAEATAIDQVASLRGRLGGFQKDILATTISSLRVSLENVSAAEAAIRDADFAVETSNLTRAQILVSSSTATLQLANAQLQRMYWRCLVSR